MCFLNKLGFMNLYWGILKTTLLKLLEFKNVASSKCQNNSTVLSQHSETEYINHIKSKLTMILCTLLNNVYANILMSIISVIFLRIS